MTRDEFLALKRGDRIIERQPNSQVKEIVEWLPTKYAVVRRPGSTRQTKIAFRTLRRRFRKLGKL